MRHLNLPVAVLEALEARANEVYNASLPSLSHEMVQDLYTNMVEQEQVPPAQAHLATVERKADDYYKGLSNLPLEQRIEAMVADTQEFLGAIALLGLFFPKFLFYSESDKTAALTRMGELLDVYAQQRMTQVTQECGEDSELAQQAQLTLHNDYLVIRHAITCLHRVAVSLHTLPIDLQEQLHVGSVSVNDDFVNTNNVVGLGAGLNMCVGMGRGTPMNIQFGATLEAAVSAQSAQHGQTAVDQAGATPNVAPAQQRNLAEEILSDADAAAQQHLQQLQQQQQQQYIQAQIQAASSVAQARMAEQNDELANLGNLGNLANLNLSNLGNLGNLANVTAVRGLPIDARMQEALNALANANAMNAINTAVTNTNAARAKATAEMQAPATNEAQSDYPSQYQAPTHTATNQYMDASAAYTPNATNMSASGGMGNEDAQAMALAHQQSLALQQQQQQQLQQQQQQQYHAGSYSDAASEELRVYQSHLEHVLAGLQKMEAVDAETLNQAIEFGHDMARKGIIPENMFNAYLHQVQVIAASKGYTDN